MINGPEHFLMRSCLLAIVFSKQKIRLYNNYIFYDEKEFQNGRT